MHKKNKKNKKKNKTKKQDKMKYWTFNVIIIDYLMQIVHQKDINVSDNTQSTNTYLIKSRGALNLGYAPCATKKILVFSLALTERPSFLPTFTQ